MIPGQASKARQQSAAKLYEKVVVQSRQPALYLDFGIPDTVDGRFDSIILHASLVIHFLAHAGESGQSTAQELFDTMFRDFNHNLRHIGIGDMSIARHFRRMSEGFNGRLRSYADAFQVADEAQLQNAIFRNVYRGENEPQSKKLFTYAWRQFQHLSGIDPNKIIHSDFDFTEPVLE